MGGVLRGADASGGGRTDAGSDEGVLDPWVARWLEEHPERATAVADLTPELLAMARGPVGFPPRRGIAQVTDSDVDGVPVRIYRDEEPPSGVVVYFHGGGFVMGSIGLMDDVARELAHASGAVVVSVEYRLAPEHPYPAGLDDCERVTRWALHGPVALGTGSLGVAVAGESAGGNLAAAVALRLRESGGRSLAGQVLVYPAVAGEEELPSKAEFDGLVISRVAGERYWAAYSAGRDLDGDGFAAPLHAGVLEGLPPALVVLGGCDMLRDEGRAYAARLRSAGVDTEEVCFAGQPHGFVNFGFPAADEAFGRIGEWLRRTFARSGAQR